MQVRQQLTLPRREFAWLSVYNRSRRFALFPSQAVWRPVQAALILFQYIDISYSCSHRLHRIRRAAPYYYHSLYAIFAFILRYASYVNDVRVFILPGDCHGIVAIE